MQEAVIVKSNEVDDAEMLAATPKDASTLAEYSPLHRTVEVLSIATFVGLCGYIAYRLGSVAQGADWLMILAGAFAGYVGSDLTSGLVHWGFDTWGSIYTPVLGKSFIRPFREHHFDQKAITRHDFIETNGNNCLVAVPVLVGTTFIPMGHGGSFGLFLATMVLFVCVGTLGTNQFHKWAHMDSPPVFVKTLQKWHVILPPDHHSIHHSAPYDTHYCITTGWLNSGLRTVGFFRILERIITATTGAEPRKDDLA